METKPRVYQRLLALVGDISLATIIFFYLCSYAFFNELSSDLVSFVGEIKAGKLEFSLYAGYIVTVFLIYFIHINLRFIFTVVMGVSLTQCFMGIFSGGNFVWKRVGGGARVVCEFFLSPFLIFDLPALIGRRTLKEVLSLTGLWSRSGILPFVSTFTVIPFLVLMALFSPMLEKLTLLDGIQVSVTKEKPEDINSKTDFSSFENVHSNYYSFSTFTSFGDSRFLLIPSFYVSKFKGDTKITPYLKIYDKQTKLEGELRVIGDIDLLKILEVSMRSNPLFVARYPAISKTLAKKRSIYAKRKYRSSMGNRTLFSDDIKREVRELTLASFELSITNAFDHLMVNGPFFRGYVVARNMMLENVKKGGTPHVQIVTFGDGHFLELSQKFNGDTVGNRFSETYLPLDSPNGKGIELSFEAEEKVAGPVIALFKKSFFSVVNWYFDYSGVFAAPIKKEELGPFAILDFLCSKKANAKQRELIEEYAYHYLFDLSKSSLVEKDRKLQSVLAVVLTRYQIVLQEHLDKGLANKKSLEFIKGLKAALINKDRGYFNY